MAAEPLDALDRTFEVTTRLTELMQRDLARRGLNLTEASTLFHLRKEGPMVQRQLSEVLGHTPRHVTSVVDALEEAGLARRAPHPEDRRAWLVTLTERGSEVADGMRRSRRAAARLLFDGLAQGDVAAYAATLEHVLGRLTSVVEEPPTAAVGETTGEGT